MEIKKGYIYTLSDETGVRYVGQTTNVKRRFNAHCSILANSSDSYKYRWIRSLLNMGKKPTIAVILETNVSDLDKEEIRLIQEFRSNGIKLVNCSNGGKDISYIYDRGQDKRWRGKHTPLQSFRMKMNLSLRYFKKIENNRMIEKIPYMMDVLNKSVDILGIKLVNDRLWEKGYGN